MKPMLVLVGLMASVVVFRIVTRRAVQPVPDVMAQPFLDSNRNSATYLYNARTGVVSSYN